MDCYMCDEDVVVADPAQRTVFDPDGNPVAVHPECMLREVVGGIGHRIAHPYWCTEHGDPDAGLTRRQSAKLTELYITLVGNDKAFGRWPTDEPPTTQVVDDVAG